MCRSGKVLHIYAHPWISPEKFAWKYNLSTSNLAGIRHSSEGKQKLSSNVFARKKFSSLTARDERIDLQVFHFKQHFLKVSTVNSEGRKNFWNVSSPKKREDNVVCVNTERKKNNIDLNKSSSRGGREKTCKIYYWEQVLLRKIKYNKTANWLWFGEKFAEGNVNIFLGKHYERENQTANINLWIYFLLLVLLSHQLKVSVGYWANWGKGILFILVIVRSFLIDWSFNAFFERRTSFVFSLFYIAFIVPLTLRHKRDRFLSHGEKYSAEEKLFSSSLHPFTYLIAEWISTKTTRKTLDVNE